MVEVQVVLLTLGPLVPVHLRGLVLVLLPDPEVRTGLARLAPIRVPAVVLGRTNKTTVTKATWTSTTGATTKKEQVEEETTGRGTTSTTEDEDDMIMTSTTTTTTGAARRGDLSKTRLREVVAVLPLTPVEVPECPHVLRAVQVVVLL